MEPRSEGVLLINAEAAALLLINSTVIVSYSPELRLIDLSISLNIYHNFISSLLAVGIVKMRVSPNEFTSLRIVEASQ